MTIAEALTIAVAPVSAIGAWVISVEKRLGIIDSMDKKLDILLEHALDQGQSRSHSSESGDRGSSR